MPSVWVDVLLGVLLLGAAVRGWQRGAVLLALTVAGFWAGTALGFLAAPLVARLASGAARTILLAAWLLVAALAGTWCGEVAGTRVHRLLRRRPLARGDQAVGAAFGLFAGAVVLWLAGTLLAAAAPAWLSGPIRGSTLLRAMADVMPDPPSLFSRLDALLNRSGLPVVLVNLPPGLATPEPLPGAAAVATAASAVQASTVKVTGVACGFLQSGSGFVAAGDLVVTNAHVVAGESGTSVTDGSGSHRASVVVFDAGLDLAVLRVPGLDAPAVTISTEPVTSGTMAAIVGYPEGGALQVAPAAINARFTAVGLDIYGTSLTSREVYELHGEVQPGDSGGPLVAAGAAAGGSAPAPGTVVGVVFSRSAIEPDVGYALAMAPVAADLAAAQTATSAVATGSCVP